MCVSQTPTLRNLNPLSTCKPDLCTFFPYDIYSTSIPECGVQTFEALLGRGNRQGNFNPTMVESSRETVSILSTIRKYFPLLFHPEPPHFSKLRNFEPNAESDVSAFHARLYLRHGCCESEQVSPPDETGRSQGGVIDSSLRRQFILQELCR